MDRPVIAIVTNLEADAHYPLAAGYPRAMLNVDYPRSIAEAGGVPVLLPPSPDLTLLAAQLELCDALLLAGGDDVDPLLYGQTPLVGTQMPNRVRDAYEFEALRVAFSLDLPVLAICRGVQLLNVWLGGTLHQDVSHAGTVLRHAGTGVPDAPAHPVTASTGSFLHEATGRTELLVNSFHHQALAHVADGLTVVAQAPDGLVEAVQLTSAPRVQRRPNAAVVGVQWHPEMMSTTDADARALFAWFVRQAAEPTMPSRALSGASRAL